jgi:cysteinyl-tRNA synthetase
LAAAADELEREATEGLFDDLNAPRALAALHTFVTAANKELDSVAGSGEPAALERARVAFGTVAGLLDVIPDREAEDPTLARWVEERLAARQSAPARRDFATADAIRREVESKGVAIEDTPVGTKWRRS